MAKREKDKVNHSVVLEDAGVNPIMCPYCGCKLNSFKVITEYYRVILRYIARGKTVMINGFGEFFPKRYKAGFVAPSSINPEGIHYPSGYLIKFKPSLTGKQVLKEEERRLRDEDNNNG